MYINFLHSLTYPLAVGIINPVHVLEKETVYGNEKYSE